MTLNEFRCWLDGFESSFNETPTPIEWKRIREMLDKITPNVEVVPRYIPLPQAPQPLVTDARTPFFVTVKYRQLV